MTKRKISKTAGAGVGFAALLAAGIMVGSGFAKQAPPATTTVPATGKVVICHKGHSITVSVKAWPAHQKHGDTVGPCQTTTTTTTTASTTQQTTTTAAPSAPGKSGSAPGHNK